MDDQTNTLQALPAAGPARDADRQHDQAIERCIELDPGVAVARILSALSDGQVLPPDAFVELAKRNHTLLHATEDEIATSLARQVVVLESLFLNFAAKAAQSGKINHMESLTKATTNVHRALLAAQGALRQVSESRRNADAIEA